jgi:hypothetical protein
VEEADGQVPNFFLLGGVFPAGRYLALRERQRWVRYTGCSLQCSLICRDLTFTLVRLIFRERRNNAQASNPCPRWIAWRNRFLEHVWGNRVRSWACLDSVAL